MLKKSHLCASSIFNVTALLWLGLSLSLLLIEEHYRNPDNGSISTIVGSVDRFLEGETYYPPSEPIRAEDIQIRSPYFPLSLFVGTIGAFTSSNIESFLFTSSLLVLLGIWFLITDLSKYLFKVPRLFASTLTAFIFFYWHSMALNFNIFNTTDSFAKPDALAVFLLLLLIKYLNLSWPKQGNSILKKTTGICFIAFCLVALGLSKQHAVFMFVGLGLSVALSKKIELYKKMSFLSMAFLSGLAVLSVIFILQNCFEITVLGQLNAGSVNRLNLFYNALWFYAWIWLPCLLGGFLHMRSGLRSIRTEALLLSGVLWFLITTYSGIRTGLRYSHQFSIIPLLPFAVLSYYQIFLLAIEIKLISNKTLNLCISLIALGVSSLYLYTPAVWLRKNHKHLKERSQIKSSYFEDNFSKKKTFYTADDYLILRRANLNLSMEYNAVGYTPPAARETANTLYRDSIKNRSFDLIVNSRSFKYGPDVIKIVMENYNLVVDSNMPKEYKNKVWVPKTKTTIKRQQ